MSGPTGDLRWPLSVPVLSDGVVTLRAHTHDDIDTMLEMANDPEMVRWTSVPTPHTRDMSENFAFSIIPQGWDTATNRGWAIEAVDDSGRTRFAGNVDVRGTPIGDLGFALHPWARGRGLMARAVRLACDWVFTDGGVEIIHWRARVGNAASLRVAHQTGFTLQGTTPGILHERGRVLDAWTGTRRFGEAPLPLVRWAESPVLESPRVRLRPFTPDDVSRIIEACSDATTRLWLAGLPHPYTPETAREYLADVAWQAATGAKATWAIADRDSDTMLGNISLMDLLGHGARAEAGYWMHPDTRGRGFATEALRLVVRHAFDRTAFDRHRLVLRAAAGNAPSNAVAVAAGFRHVGTETAAEPLGDGSLDDLHHYELLR